MIYADYSYYTDSYSGNAVGNEKDFNRLALKASAFLDAITFGRIDKESTISDAIKNAMCAIVDIKQGYLDGTKGIVSETTGRVSRTYAYSGSGQGEKTEESECYQAAYEFLSNTGLLYKGIYDAYTT